MPLKVYNKEKSSKTIRKFNKKKSHLKINLKLPKNKVQKPYLSKNKCHPNTKQANKAQAKE